MRDRSDSELLREYAEGGPGAQAAFGALVARHVNLVHTAAARQVHDRHAADDVTQAVFVILARKARKLRPGTVLAAWLLGVTRYAAKDWNKTSARRRRHEEAAARQRTEQMSRGTFAHPMTSAGSAASAAASTPVVAGLDESLDDAIARLPAAGREALVLRFFENRSFKEVAGGLGITEEAAKKRVLRALDRLRELLGRGGVRVSSDALGMALAATAVQPAPAGIGAAAASGATAAALAAHHAALVDGALQLMLWSKLKAAAVGTAAVVLVGAAGTAVALTHGSWRLPQPRTEAAANPTTPVTTPAAPATAQYPWWSPRRQAAPAAPYRPAGPVVGIVRAPDGRPVAGAEVILTGATRYAPLYGPADPTMSVTRTGDDGRFEITPRERPLGVIVRTLYGAGIGSVSPAEGGTTAPMSVVLRAWGRVQGSVRVGSRPAAGALLRVYTQSSELSQLNVLNDLVVRVEDDGRFVAERVWPGEVLVMVSSGSGSRNETVHVEPGKTAEVAMGGRGRPVIGRVSLPADAEAMHRQGYLTPRVGRRSATRPSAARPSADATTPPAAPPRPPRPVAFTLNGDGSFRIDDVEGGDYQIQVNVGQSVRLSGTARVETIASGSTTVTVPPAPGGQTDEPVDVGEIPVKLFRRLKVGEPAPEIAGTDLRKSPLRLSDFRGKHVLLVISASWDADTLHEVSLLKAVHDRFRDDERFTALGVVLPENPSSVRSSVGLPNVPWPQIMAGRSGPDRLPEEYNVSSVAIHLVGPDGSVVAKNLHAGGAYAAADKALGHARPAAGSARVTIDHLAQPQAATDPAAPFRLVPPPAPDDAATAATFAVVDAETTDADRGAGLQRLRDGKMPVGEDAPGLNFFFEPGTIEGRLRVDLGREVAITAINTYSWHKGFRGPQVYTVYGSDGAAPGFNDSPKIGTDPAKQGWTKIAVVDTRPADVSSFGGRHAVSITAPSGPPSALGRYRHLLFEAFATETSDMWGQTFFSEIDVIEGK